MANRGEAQGDTARSRCHGLGGESRWEAPLSCISGITGRLMERGYSALGLAIGKRPKHALAMGLLLYVLFFPGLFMLEGDQRLVFINLNTNFFEQFVFSNSQYYLDYKRATALFPEPRSNVLIHSSREGSLASEPFLRKALAVEREVLAQAVEHEGRTYGYEDLCHRASAGGPCSRSSLVSLLVPDPTVLDELAGATPATVAGRLVQAVHPFLWLQLQVLAGSSTLPFPGTAANATQLSRWLAGAKSGLSIFHLRPGVASRLFELKVERILEDFHGREEGPLRLTGYLEATMGGETTKVLTSVLWLMGLALLLMVAYVVTFLATQTRLPGQSQVLVVAVSALLPALASLAGIGSLGYMGLPLNILGLTAPLLVLAQGVDAVFVLVSALKSMGPELDMPTAISRAVAKGGAAITITAFTSICAFGVSWLAMSHFIGVSSLNYLLAASIALSNSGMLIIVPALLALGERRMLSGKMDLFPWRPQPNGEGWPVTKLLQSVDPGPRLQKFVTHTYAPLPEQSRLFVAAGILVFVVLMGTGAVGFSRVGSGMPDVHFVKDSSYMQGFVSEIESQFGGATPMEMGLLLERPALHDPAYSSGLSELLGELDASPDVFLVDCSSLYPPRARIVNGTGRCSAFVGQPTDPLARAAQAKRLMALVAGAGVPALAYHKSFPLHVFRMETVRPAILSTVRWALITVFGALLLTLPVHMALVSVANVCCILLSLFGFMGFTGVTFCANTFVACIMAVGFCVDYTCHIVHAAVHDGKPDEPWASHMRHALEARGYDVLHGCITAMLGIALLAFAGSAAFRTVTYTIFLVLIFGGIYALVTLPALLSVATLFRGPVHQCERTQVRPGKLGTCSSPTPSLDLTIS